MRVLVACEFSGAVRSCFRSLGHDAWSCDLEPAEDYDSHHLQVDVREVLADRWDLMVAHPPCTHLSVSGARYWRAKQATGQQQQAIALFADITRAPIERIAVENPVSIISTLWRKPDQIIHPWQFGHRASKPTCLWLKNLPPLKPTRVVDKGRFYTKANGRHLARWSHLKSGTKDGPERARVASRTFPGIAFAMATQWG